MKTACLILAMALCGLISHNLLAATTTSTTRPTSAFFPAPLLQRIRHNAAQSHWGRELRERAIANAEPWNRMSDEQLLKLMFGATILRSWHVLSNGAYPSCRKSVPMYD